MADHVVYVGSEPWTLPGPAARLYPEPGPSRMRRQNPMSHEEVIAYNLRNGGQEFTVFEEAQNDRVMKARAIIARILDYDGRRGSKWIVEPGCSTGDISGPFAGGNTTVYGIDVTPGAAHAARQKWPNMVVYQKEVEELDPIPCDILVLCEFLEHITDPVGFVKKWVPLAKYVVIGHPIVGDGSDPEPGHPWAYYDEDFANWFPMGGHKLREAWEFPMGYRMVIGWGERE